MPEIGLSVPTWADVVKTLDPNGAPARIINLMARNNGFMRRASIIEANMPNAHRVSMLVGLPAPTWRKFNQGITPSTDSYATVDEGIGMAESVSEVDKALADATGNPALFRLQRARSHIEGIVQEISSTIFYGTKEDATKFVGLAPRYSVLSGDPIAQNVISGGGTGSDNLSIWLVSFDPDRITLVFPKGHQGAGVEHEDLGMQVNETVGGVAGSKMRVYRDWFSLYIGLAVADWRYAVRICNIDVSELKALSTSAPNLFDLAIEAVARLPIRPQGNTYFFMNRVAYTGLVKQARKDVMSGGGLEFRNVAGEDIPHLHGFPIEIDDALLTTEAAVV